MKIFLTDKEVIELAYDALDMSRPDPDKVHEVALRMDMVYDEDMDMFEDIEEVSLRKYRRQPAQRSNAVVFASVNNCNHSWYTDLSGTVALRRCRFCVETAEALPEHLWEQSQKLKS